MVELGSTSITIVSVIAAVAVASLLIAVVLRRQVLAAGEGTESMREIARAVQEGASAYLSRQFRTLALFAVVVCALLFLLPGDGGVKIGRSVFFLIGAGPTIWIISSTTLRQSVTRLTRMASAVSGRSVTSVAMHGAACGSSADCVSYENQIHLFGESAGVFR